MDKQCGSCRFQKVYEWEKPCMGYREGCQFYQKGENMTRDEAIKELSEMRTDAWTDSRQMEALKMAVNVLKQNSKTGHWKRISIDRYITHAQYWYRCDRCGKDNLGNTDWCPNCGCRMIESHESEDKG